jgi:two-component system, LytTR family, sensor kinase
MLDSTAYLPPVTRHLVAVTQPSNAFWVLHVAGWLGISLLTYLSLSLPYDQFEASYLAHNIAQSVLGMFLSLPMRYLFRWIWHWSLVARALMVVFSTVLLSAFWASARLELFILMTHERVDLWEDFGGWLFPSIFVFATWAALYHVIKYYQLLQGEQQNLVRLESERRQEALKLARAEAAARDAQLRLLRYQLNPHFLFNTLNSVAALINSDRTVDAGAMVNRLGKFLRYSLEDHETNVVTVADELNAVKQYLEIEQVRFSDRLKISVEVDEAAKRCQVPSLVIQPLVENSIKHAFGRAERPGEIRIGVRRELSQLVITVEDSGPADRSLKEMQRIADTMLQHPGVGLANTQARLANLYGEYSSVSTDISNLGGIKVMLSIPANEQAPSL